MLIYKITNLVHGRVYIGQTIQSNPKARWYSHWDYVRKGRKSYLYDSMRKHGMNNFSWEIIDQANSIEELNELEAKWLDHYRAIGEVYNNREAGGNKKHSSESIERMSVAQKLRHATRKVGGWKRIDGGPMLGKSHPGKGAKRTQEQRERITEGLTNFYASEQSVATREKISRASRNPESIEKRKQGIQKMLSSEKGINYRKKMSESIKRVWAERKATQGTSSC
jgi:group I intron endonuclease